jgi:hypothetical protein
MRSKVSPTLFAAIVVGCGGQAASAVSFGLEPATLVPDDASFEEPQEPSSTLTSRRPPTSAAPDAGASERGSPGRSREVCPVRCHVVVPGRAPLEPAGDADFVAQLQPTVDRLVASDPSLRPSPTLTLRFAEDGSLVAAGVDEAMAQGVASQCLHDSADLEGLKALRSLPGAIVRCQERCAGVAKPKRGPKGRRR